MNDLALSAKQNYRLLIAIGVLVAMFATFIILHPRGLSINVLTIWANQGTALAFVAAAQTLAVLTSGLDLSVGAVLALCNCLASEIVNGSPIRIALGVLIVLVTGITCGFVNGLLVVKGRIQPIIATLASGAVYTGFALLLRPTPGGDVSEGFSEALTYDILGLVPTSLILLLGAVLLIWVPFKRTTTGRGVYAVGSAEGAAYMAAVNVDLAKMMAYILGGLFAAFGGLFLGLQTLSGDATLGFSYTLNSIASVVIGGTALSGGTGGVVGSIVGAFILRTINGMMFFAGAPPLAQPFFEGLVLLAAVSLGALRLIRLRNRLDVMS